MEHLNEWETCIDEWATRCREKDATIAALQARVQELEQWVQDQSTANLETMRHTDEMQSRALEAEQQLTQRTAELEAAKAEVNVLRTSERLAGVLPDPSDQWSIDTRIEIMNSDSAQLLADTKAAIYAHYECAALNWAFGLKAYKDLQAELERVRALIKALPKVEGEITVRDGTALYWTSDGTYGSIDCKEQLVSLLKHRQWMEG